MDGMGWKVFESHRGEVRSNRHLLLLASLLSAAINPCVCTARYLCLSGLFFFFSSVPSGNNTTTLRERDNRQIEKAQSNRGIEQQTLLPVSCQLYIPLPSSNSSRLFCLSAFLSFSLSTNLTPLPPRVIQITPPESQSQAREY